MADVKPMKAGPIMTNQEVPLRVNEVLKILKTIDHERCVNTMPYHPKGGEVYVFKPLDDETRLDWRDDGYTWKNQGTTRLPRKNPTMQKKYFYAIREDGQSNVKVRKDCFYREPGDDPDFLTLIHYLGNLGNNSAVDEVSSVVAVTGRGVIHVHTADETTVLEEIAVESLSELNRIIQLHVGGEPQMGTILIDPMIEYTPKNVQGMPPENVENNTRDADPPLLEPEVAELASQSIPDVTQQHTPDVSRQSIPDVTQQYTTDVSGQSIPDVTQKNTPDPPNTGIESSPLVNPPDLSAAMATMKAALAANQTDKPVMEMFSRLMDSVTSENKEVELTLVVSDKKSGESSMIGTNEGKELVGKSPQILNTLRGKRRRTGNPAMADHDGEDEPLAKMTRSRRNKTTPSKFNGKSESVGQTGRPAKGIAVSESESQSNLDISDDDQEDTVEGVRNLLKSVEKVDSVRKRGRRSIKTQETIAESESNLDSSDDKQVENVEGVRKSRRLKTQEIGTSEESKTTKSHNRKENGIPAKVPQVIKAVENTKSVENNLRSSSRTRKFNTPNWRDILSGRKSFVSGENKKQENSEKKSNKFANRNNSNSLDVKMSGNIATERLVQNEAAKKGRDIPRTVLLNVMDEEIGTEDTEKSKLLDTPIADNGSKDSPKWSVNKAKRDDKERIEVVTRELKVKNKTVSNNSKNIASKLQENEFAKVSVDKGEIKTTQKIEQTINNNASSRPRRRISLTRKYDEFETDSPIIRHTQSTDSPSKGQSVKIGTTDANDSSEIKKSNIFILNKSSKEISKPASSKNNPLKTKAFNDAMNSTSKMSSFPKETQKKRKIKKKGNRHILSASYDDDDEVDEEDILEWKGVGDIKKGRPKGSGFKKFDLVAETAIPTKDLAEEFSKKNLPETRRTESTYRSSSRISYNFICESCGRKFCQRYMLEVHMRVSHPEAEIPKADTVVVIPVKDGRGRKPKIEPDTGADVKAENKDKEKTEPDEDEADTNYIDSACIDDRSVSDPDWNDDIEDLDEEVIGDGDSSVSEDFGDSSHEHDEIDSTLPPKSIRKRGPRMPRAPHKCPLCVERYADRGDLEKHVFSLHKQSLSDVEFQLKDVSVKRNSATGYECVICQLRFNTRTECSTHKRNVHKVDYGLFNHFGYIVVDTKYRCEICQVDFESFDKYLDHRSDHLNFPFLCRQCGNGFHENDYYIQHVQSGCEVTTMHLSCGICDQTFPSCDARRKHVYTLHPKTTEFFCHHCGKCLDGMEELRKHFPVHIKDKIFRCDFCDKSFRDKRGLESHRDLHRSTKTFKCQDCDKLYISVKSLERHRMTHFKEISVKFQCTVCEKSFAYKSEQIKHEQIHFEGTLDSDKCNICGKSFATRDRLMKHLQHHNDDESTENICQICEATFPTSAGLWKHKKATHGSILKGKKKQKTWICETCGFSTIFKGRLKRHLEIHNTEKIFQCEYCSRKFQTYSSLSTHRILHRGKIRKGAIQFHICRWENCSRKYLKKAVLKRHLASHLFRLRKGRDVCDCEACHQTRFGATTTIPMEANNQVILNQDSVPSVSNLTHQSHIEHVLSVEPGNVNLPLEPQGIQQALPNNSDSLIQVSDIQTALENAIDSVVQVSDIQTAIPNTTDSVIQVSDIQTAIPNATDIVIQVPINSEAKAESLDILQAAISQMESKMDQTGVESGTPTNTDDMVTWPNEIDGQTVDININATGTEDVETNEIVNGNEAGQIDPKSQVGDHGDGEQENEIYFECSLCDIRLPTKCQVLLHSKTDHQDYTYPACEVCGKTFIDHKNLLEHASVHTGAKPFECETCQKCFRTKSSWRQHSFVHAVNKPYVCSYCGHGFTQKGYFDLHIRRHTGDRPFECDICHKAFVSKEMLKRHYYVHSGEKPYICDECGKTFIDSTSLTAHRRTHNDDRPFACERCEKAFFTNAKLTRHLKMVHGLEMDMISDFVPTKVGLGIGWRKKDKFGQGDINRPTQIVYIDEQGNVLSRVDNQYGRAELNVEEDSNRMVEVENDMQMNCEEESSMEDDQPIVIEDNNTNAIVNTVNDSTADIVMTDQSFQVVTRRDSSGQLQVDAISVPDNQPGPTPTHVSLPDPNSDVSKIQIIDGNIVQNQNYTYVTQEGEQTSDTQHLQLITQALASHGVGDGQIQVVEGLKGEQIQTTPDGNIAIYADQEGVMGDNISINIREDGTVNMADIEALRNMYNDEPIVIFLENE